MKSSSLRNEKYTRMREDRKRRIIVIALLVILMVVGDVLLFSAIMPDPEKAIVYLSIGMEAEEPVTVGVSYSTDSQKAPTAPSTQIFQGGRVRNGRLYPIRTDARSLTISFGDGAQAGPILWTEPSFRVGPEYFRPALGPDDEATSLKGITILEKREAEHAALISCDADAAITISLDGLDLAGSYRQINSLRYHLYGCLACLILDLLLVFVFLLFVRRRGAFHEVFVHTWEKEYAGLCPAQWLLILLVFLICICGAVTLDAKDCPDEYGRQLLTEYIFQSGRLPTGNEPETIMAGWGFSYALRPFLSSMIGAVFMKLASFFTSSSAILELMARMCSVLSLTLCCLFCLRIGNELFESRKSSLLMAVLICFMPQVMFLGMYLNNDSLGLMAVSMELYFLLRGDKKGWDYKSCIGLGLAFAIILLSYYSVYIWGAAGAVYFLVSCLRASRGSISVSGEKPVGFVMKRILLIAGITLVLAGWFFVRNAMLHNGDFLGIASEMVSREQRAKQGIASYGYYVPHDTGISLIGFLLSPQYEWGYYTLRSTIGYFGHMDLPLPGFQYGEYYAFVIVVILGFAVTLKSTKPSKLFRNLVILAVIASIGSIVQSLLHSYYRDMEPQGRYIICIVLLWGLIAGYTADHARLYIRAAGSGEKPASDRIFGFSEAAILIWIVMFILVWFGTMTRMII